LKGNDWNKSHSSSIWAVLFPATGIVKKNLMGKQAFSNKKRLLTGNINLDLKKKIVKSTIWSVVLYGAETWTMTQADK